MNHSESGNCLDRCPIRLNLNSNNNNEVSPAETAGWDGSSSFFKIESKPSGIVQFDEIVSLKDPGGEFAFSFSLF
jgi:hypothetical protein